MKTKLTLGLIVALLSAAATAIARPTLSNVETTKVGDGLEIKVNGSGLARPKVLRVMSGSSYILEFAGHLAGSPRRTDVGHAGVKYIETVWFTARPARVRVHLKLDPSVEPKLVDRDGSWAVLVNLDQPMAKTTGWVNPLDVMTPIQDELVPLEDVPIFLPSTDSQTVAPPTPPTPALPPALQTRQADLARSPLQLTPSTRATATAPTAPRVRLVTLDFVGTDVVQILKALSIQAGVNIVAAPDVSPEDKPLRLTLSLSEVTVDESLSLITAMAGLRYARVGNTFVVTKSDQFNGAMRQILERNADNYQTRVVNLASGEASQIREATVRALPQDGRSGFYEIIVPGLNDTPAVAAPTTTTAPPNGDQSGSMLGDPANPASPPSTPTGTTAPSAPTNVRASYVLLVGDPARLDQVERYVRDLDTRISASFSLNASEDIGTVVVPILSGQTDRIKTMLERLLANNPRATDYSITASSLRDLAEGEESTQVVLMIGPKDELATLERFAIALDEDLCEAVGISTSRDAASRERVYEVVDLQYLEPTIAEFDLKSRVRGLYVTVLPDPVTPGIKGEDEGSRQDQPTDQPGAGAGGAGAPATEAQRTEMNRQIGREPMRLVLRGTREQIKAAKDYLALVDIAPKQVALELRVMEMTKEDALRVGIDWSILTGGRLTSLRINQGSGDTAATPGTISGSYTFRGSDTANVLATLDKIANDRNLIARPNALISDGRSTSLFVGDTVRYVKSIQSSQNGTTVTTDEVEVGVLFNVKARVGGDNSVALDLEQNFSLLTSFLPVPGGGSLPQTSDRRTTMFVNMKSGETIAIGGLIQEQDRKRISGIPILMDLPIIGQFFRRTDTQRQRTEIVFFLTAVVVDETNRANAASPRTGLSRTPDPMGDYKKTGKPANP